MPEDFGKDMLMLGGTVVGFIAAMLTLMEKLLDIREPADREEGTEIAFPNRTSGRRPVFPRSISFRRNPSVVSPISSCTKPA